MITNNNITFRGKPGASIIIIAEKELGESQKIGKYTKLYTDTFFKNIDESTVIDLSNDYKYVFSSTIFPDVKYVSEKALEIKDSILKSLLKECPHTLSRLEISLYRKIISVSKKRGMSINNLRNMAERIKNNKSRQYFLENLDIAERIIKENPKSKLSIQEFDYMSNVIMAEEANTPGTELYNLANNFDASKLVFE